MDKGDPSTTSGVLASSKAEAPRDRDPHSGSGRLEVRCPNCHTPMEVAVDTLLTDLTCSVCGSHFSLVDQSQATRMAPPLSTMGRFELIERLGVGGFGSVWKARDRELDRTVAIKIPRQGGMTSEQQEKFFREARAAAQLRHSNIVSVHEVGRDGENVYIVSDFVRGVTLGDWLTGQQLTSREAAELCARIAGALHHAHEQGVVHRDLKPANIMIDGAGDPHLMDFGLARRDAGEVTVTMDGEVLGTPAYMSPEQALGEAHTADRRSDVYSLGVILFQLLTGELPFRGNVRMIMHQVIHDEPPSPRKLNANVSDDLETIALKCLQKEPSRRYATALELADDLRRFLADEPIHARPISRYERAARWIRRNPAVSALSTAVVILLVAGTIVSAYFAIDAREKASIAVTRQKDAEAARAEETRARKESEAVTEFLVKAFQSTDPARGGRRAVTVAEVLDQAEKKVAEELSDQPLTQAALFRAIGTSRLGLGMWQEAIGPLTKAKDLRFEKLGDTHLDTLWSMYDLAAAYLDANRHEESIALYEHTLKAMRQNLGPEHAHTLMSQGALAIALQRAGRLDEAISLHEKTVSTMRQRLSPDHRLTLDAMHSLATAYGKAKRDDEAIALYEEALAGMRKQLGARHSRTISLMQNLAVAYGRAERHQDAIRLLEEAIEGLREMLGPDHIRTVEAATSLASTYRAAGRPGEANQLEEKLAPRTPRKVVEIPEIKSLEKTLEQRKKKSGAQHPDTMATMAQLAQAYVDARRPDKALALYQQLIDSGGESIAKDHKTLEAIHSFAHRLAATGWYDHAIRLFQLTRSARVATLGEMHSDTLEWTNCLAEALIAAGRTEEALPLHEQFFKGWRTKLRPDNPGMLMYVKNLLHAYRAAQRLDEATSFFNEQLLADGFFYEGLQLGTSEVVNAMMTAAMTDRYRGEDVPEPIDAMVLGELRLVGGDTMSAEAAIRAAIARAPADYMYKSLGWCLLAQGSVNEAKEAFEEALKDRRREDGNFDLEGANYVEMTAAYFLDLVSEEQYVAHTAGKSEQAAGRRVELACFPWFYVGQRREMEGNREAAIAAYEKCVELDDDETAHSNRALARWRLAKLREGAEGKTDLQQ